MLKNKIRVVAAIAALTLSGFASAQAYLGSSVGQAKWKDDCKGSVNCDTSGNSYKLFGGYNLDNNFAVEASYFSLGNISADFNQKNVTANSKIKGKGFELAGLYKYDFNNEFSAFAKLGIASTKTESTTNLANVISSNISNDFDSTSLWSWSEL